MNLWSAHPEDAWFEMLQTWKDRTALKQAAGVKLSGRDNKEPVLHFSLAWHEKDAPTPEQMRAAALSALQALQLDGHQALIIAHRDEPHPHVHLLVNTVHPETGKTAKLSNSKLELSRWAEAYERAHAQEHCPERRRNNARRDELRQQRAAEKAAHAKAEHDRSPLPERKPYEPVKDRSPNRRVHLEKAEVIARMRALHSELRRDQRLEKNLLWDRQKAARLELENTAERHVRDVSEQQREKWRPRWRQLYRDQGAERRHVERTCTHPFERAVYVFSNRHDLAGPGRSLSVRQMAGLIVSPKRLMKAVEAKHERQRRSIAREQKAETKVLTDHLWRAHRETFHQLAQRQGAEREALHSHHDAERGTVTFQRARDELAQAKETADQFRQAAHEQPEPKAETRSERIAREIEEARAHTGRKGGDFDRGI